jgi:DNA-3-methyladenine glycosylase
MWPPPDAAAPARALPPPLPRAFFARATTRVARELLGKTLVRRMPGGDGVRAARIVEVEAYLGPRDLASHARRGPTPRTSIMFGPPGHLYVYLIYGMYHCMNFVAETDGVAGAVLIRAAEPLEAGADARALAGPGKLCRGLAVTLADRGLDLTSPAGGLYVAEAGDGRLPRAARSPRIGVDYAGDWAARPLRFFIPGNRSVSGPRAPLLSPRTSRAARPTPARR